METGLIAALRFRGSVPNYSVDVGILSVAWITVSWCRYFSRRIRSIRYFSLDEVGVGRQHRSLP